MSVKVMNWVFEHSRTDHAADRLVLLTIADRANDEGSEAWPSVDTLCRKTRLSKSTVLRSIARLEELGELEVEREEGLSNRYTVNMRPYLPMEHQSQTDTSPRGNQFQSDTGINLKPVSHVTPPPVSLVTPNTSCTSSTHTARETVTVEAAPPLPFTRPRRSHAPGLLAGALPRDFADRELFGGRLTVKTATLNRWALRHSATLETGRAAVCAWLAAFAGGLSAETAIGDQLWLERHFDAWLAAQGRTTPPPAGKPLPPRATEPTGRAVPDAAATNAMLKEMLG